VTGNLWNLDQIIRQLAGTGANTNLVPQQAVRPIDLQVTDRSSGLTVPARSVPSPLDYFGVYLTVDDYLESMPGAEEASRTGFIRWLMSAASRESLLNGLCFLVLARQEADHSERLASELSSWLTPPARARLEAALTGKNREILARQPLLLALRTVLARADTPDPEKDPPYPLEIMALMLTHALSSTLTASNRERSGRQIAGLPEQLAIEVVCNQAFYESDDLYSVIDRQLRLWREMGSAATAHLGGRNAAGLFGTAAGLEVEDVFALGFALYAHVMNWRWGQPIRLHEDFNSDMPSARISAFLDLVAASPEQLRPRLQQPLSDWDFLAFQETPVLHVGDGLMVVDDELLLQRITTGLFWIVHDYLSATEGNQARQRWTQAWGEMVEAVAEQDLSSLAPPLLSVEHLSVYYENDLAIAYPGHKTADVVIDFGEVLGAFEIVSGQLQVNTRINGDRDALYRDMERLAFKKVRQLDDTARCLLQDEAALTGIRGVTRQVAPVIVAGGGFPLSPITARIIHDYCADQSLLVDGRIRPLAVIDMGELEALEGLAEHLGADPMELLKDWAQSGLATMSFRNFMLQVHPWSPDLYRPSRMRPRVDAVFEQLAERLRFRVV